MRRGYLVSEIFYQVAAVDRTAGFAYWRCAAESVARAIQSARLKTGRAA